MKLLGVRVPLPVTGTLSRPLPNIPVFVPELVKAVGLSAFELPGEVLTQVSRLNPLQAFSLFESGEPVLDAPPPRPTVVAVRARSE